jgi:hypothetical protein
MMTVMDMKCLKILIMHKENWDIHPKPSQTSDLSLLNHRLVDSSGHVVRNSTE